MMRYKPIANENSRAHRPKKFSTCVRKFAHDEFSRPFAREYWKRRNINLRNSMTAPRLCSNASPIVVQTKARLYKDQETSKSSFCTRFQAHIYSGRKRTRARCIQNKWHRKKMGDTCIGFKLHTRHNLEASSEFMAYVDWCPNSGCLSRLTKLALLKHACSDRRCCYRNSRS